MDYQKKSKKQVTPSVSRVPENTPQRKSPGLWSNLLENPNLYAPAFIVLLSLGLYFNTLWNRYALDDRAVIEENRFTQQGIAGIPMLLHTFYWQGFWDNNAGLYRPLSMITFAIEWQISPNNPHLSHATNVVLYAISGYLLFLVLSLLLSKFNSFLPLIITALYVAHPIHTEVVANIKSRDEILCFLLFLLTVYFLLHNIRKPSWRSFLFAVVSYFLCLLSKESAITFLVIFPIILFFFTELPYKQYLRILYPFVLTFLGYLLLRILILDAITTTKVYTYLDNSLVASPTIGIRLATAIYILGKYLWLLCFPYPLSYDYSFLEIPFRNWSDYQTFLPLIIYSGAMFYAIKNIFSGKKDLISFGIIFFLTTISIVSNTVFLIGATMAERFLYIPSLGFCIIIAILILKIFRVPLYHQPLKKGKSWTIHHKMMMLFLSVVLIIFASLVVNRNRDWKTNATLFENDVTAAPGSSRVHYNFGTLALSRYNRENPDTAMNNHELATAVSELQKSLDIDSAFPLIYLNLSNACYAQGKYMRAIENASQCIKRNPGEAKAYSVLGNAYYRVHDYPNAILNLQKSIELKYTSSETYNFLGGAYVGISDLSNALLAYQKAVEMDKTNVELIANLANVYGMAGDYRHAIQYFKEAILLKPNNTQFYILVSNSYTYLGKPDSARYYAALAPTTENKK